MRKGEKVARKGGRIPRPTTLKIMAGVQNCRINRNEPKAPPGRPDPQAELGVVARAEWDRIIPMLESMNVLTKADGAILALYCTNIQHWFEAEQDLKENGLTTETITGHLKPSPYLQIANKAMDNMRRCLIEFGLTPASRSSVKAAPAEDELAAFVAKRKGRK
jgi:P27 family predicted phage terminase small subunit